MLDKDNDLVPRDLGLGNKVIHNGKESFHMSDKIPQEPLEIKHAGQAIECGALEVLLNAVVSQPVFVMPLQQVVSNGAQAIRRWAVFLSVQPYMKHGPVYYATFLAAEAIGIGLGVGLTYPHRFLEATALQRGNALQEELTQCLCQVLTQNPRVSGIVLPARYRLPDEWVWSNRCKALEIHLHEQHWTVSKPNVSF